MAASRPVPPAQTVFQLRIMLEDSHPAIWRRLLVPGGIRLARLHEIFQAAMGWTNSHLHNFEIADKRYGMDLDEFATNQLNEKDFTVLKAIGDERRFRYTYDFGDNWEHEVVVEAVSSWRLGLKSAVCLDGQRACPPEDCGGVYGYAHLLEVIADPDDEEFDELTGWLDGPFDAEAFDLAAANIALQHFG